MGERTLIKKVKKKKEKKEEKRTAVFSWGLRTDRTPMEPVDNQRLG
jgi:hypothetical protein